MHREKIIFLAKPQRTQRNNFFMKYFLETVETHSIFMQNHPHDDPRTWFRGRVAPHGLRSVGFFPLPYVAGEIVL